MELTTKYNIGDKIFYKDIYCSLDKECPCCGGEGQIVGKDGGKYSCPNFCCGGMKEGYNIYGIFYGEIVELSVHVYGNKPQREWIDIIPLGVILEEDIGREKFDVREINGLKDKYWFKDGKKTIYNITQVYDKAIDVKMKEDE